MKKPKIPRWAYVLIGLLGGAILAATPASATHTFDDVADGQFWHSDVDWLAGTGVTLGCSPANYCPFDFVNRGQMATFLHRFADNVGPGLIGSAIGDGDTIDVNFAVAGGDGGAATTVARGDHIHDLRYFTESELQTVGVINTGGNPVQWTKLVGVPAGFADGTDAIDGGDAQTLDGINSPSFLRSDASDSYTSGTLTFAPVSTLDINSDNIRIGQDSAADDDGIFFDASFESLFWRNATTTFELTDNLALEADLRIGGLGGPCGYSVFSVFGGGCGAPAALADLDSGDVFAQGDVEVGDRLYVPNTAVIGDGTPTLNQGFNSIGEASGTDSGSITGINDLYIADALEVDGISFLPFIQGSGTTSYSAGVDVLDEADGNFRINIDANNGGIGDFEVFSSGGYANTDQQLALTDDTGNLQIRGLYSNGAFDLAESFLSLQALEPGSLVRVDPSNPIGVQLTAAAYDPGVIGIVSTKPGIIMGGTIFDTETLRQAWGEEVFSLYQAREKTLKTDVLNSVTGPEKLDNTELQSQMLERFVDSITTKVALAGRVPVKVDTQFGAIKAGDMLTASPIPGVAMKATQPGPVVGTALQGLESGSGKILVFVNRTWFAPQGGDASLVDRMAALEAQNAQLASQIAALTGAPATTQQAPAVKPPAELAPEVEAPAGSTQQKTEDITGMFLGSEQSRGSIAGYAAIAAAIMLIGMLIGARIVVTVAARRR